ncbi:hypothetical protein [Francisella tularensis]|nr:hypothetical protein [Francisella tularensis]
MQRANNTKYGLASYFFSNDNNQIRRVRNALAIWYGWYKHSINIK